MNEQSNKRGRNGCFKFEGVGNFFFLFFSFFFYLSWLRSCPAAPHPQGCPRNSFAVTPEELHSTVQHIHLTLITERSMGLLARRPDNCSLHGVGMYSHSHYVAMLRL